MATVFYRFSDGHIEEIEVTEKVSKGICELEKEDRRSEWRQQWRERKKLVSLDAMQEQGRQLDNGELSVEEHIVNEETNDERHKALAAGYRTLSAEQKKLLRLIYVDGKELKDIARIYGVTYQAIQNRHSKILNKLRKFFR